MLLEMVVLKESIFKLQKAFVTERAELIDNNRKKWDTSMLQRRDKEVKVESIIYTFPITPMLVGNHSNPAMSLHTVIWLHLSHCIKSEKKIGAGLQGSGLLGDAGIFPVFIFLHPKSNARDP